jgi:hypothetical protein
MNDKPKLDEKEVEMKNGVIELQKKKITELEDIVENGLDAEHTQNEILLKKICLLEEKLKDQREKISDEFLGGVISMATEIEEGDFVYSLSQLRTLIQKVRKGE